MGAGAWIGSGAFLSPACPGCVRAPGLEIDRPSDRRLRVHLTLSVTAAGAEAITVSPGLSLGYRW
jgi:hypothetical protein